MDGKSCWVLMTSVCVDFLCIENFNYLSLRCIMRSKKLSSCSYLSIANFRDGCNIGAGFSPSFCFSQATHSIISTYSSPTPEGYDSLDQTVHCHIVVTSQSEASAIESALTRQLQRPLVRVSLNGKSIKIRTYDTCGMDGILNECLGHLPRRPLVHSTHLFNHSLRLSHFPQSWKEAKIITVPKTGKDCKTHWRERPA
jgi:hypothetical protein